MELSKEEISELYYLCNRQFNYYSRKYQRIISKQVYVGSKIDYLYERCKTFKELCNKLLNMNPDTLVHIEGD